jgi:hypothetical protein
LVELIAYRCAASDTPFRVDASPSAGRYNRAGEAPTTYLGLHPLTPWAEILRALGVRDESAAIDVRPPLWTARVALEESETVELTFDTAADFGLTADDLVADDRTACQALAAGLRADPLGPKAIIAPSAALPGPVIWSSSGSESSRRSWSSRSIPPSTHQLRSQQSAGEPRFSSSLRSTITGPGLPTQLSRHGRRVNAMRSTSPNSALTKSRRTRANTASAAALHRFELTCAVG